MSQRNEFLRVFLKSETDLKAYIFSVIRDRQSGEDIFQDVAMILWEKFDQFDRSRSFDAWARGIARNRILKHWEQNRQSHPTLTPEALNAVSDSYARHQFDTGREQDALRECIQKLPEKSRRLIALRYENSLKLQDLASQVGLTLDAAHKSLSRIRLGLQRCIEQRMSRSEAI